MTYKPNPIDTSSVALPEDILELTELLAQNNHDHWALQRLQEGWRYGPEKTSLKKEHPDLIPYVELPDSEKELDRKAAIETLKAIIALGYVIKKA